MTSTVFAETINQECMKNVLVKYNPNVHDLEDLEATLCNFLKILFSLEYEPTEEYPKTHKREKNPNAVEVKDEPFPLIGFNVYIDTMAKPKEKMVIIASLMKALKNRLSIEKKVFEGRESPPLVLRQMHVYYLGKTFDVNPRSTEDFKRNKTPLNYEFRERELFWGGGSIIKGSTRCAVMEVVSFCERPWENKPSFASNESDLILCVESGTIVSPRELENMFENYEVGEYIFFPPYLRCDLQGKTNDKLEPVKGINVVWKTLSFIFLYLWYQFVSCTCALCNFRSDVFYCGEMEKFSATNRSKMNKDNNNDDDDGDFFAFPRSNFKAAKKYQRTTSKFHEASSDNGILFPASKYFKSQLFMIKGKWEGSKMCYFYFFMAYIYWVKFVIWQEGSTSKVRSFLVWNNWISFPTFFFAVECIVRIVTFLNTRQVKVITVRHKNLIYYSKLALDLTVSFLSPFLVFPLYAILWVQRNVFNGLGIFRKSCRIGSRCKALLCCCFRCRGKRDQPGNHRSKKSSNDSEDENDGDEVDDFYVDKKEAMSKSSGSKKSYMDSFLKEK